MTVPSDSDLNDFFEREREKARKRERMKKVWMGFRILLVFLFFALVWLMGFLMYQEHPEWEIPFYTGLFYSFILSLVVTFLTLTLGAIAYNVLKRREG